VARLAARVESVATAESLTGGRVCAELTAVPGASAVVRGGVVAYTPQAKREVLAVPEDLLARRGTVAAETALAMAHGVRRLLAADWAVATTGVAGPEPSEGKPVGTVYLAVVGPGERGEERVGTSALTLSGSRTQIRAATVSHALQLLEEVVPGE
jgi:nicotinamide-nucleotide amidase